MMTGSMKWQMIIPPVKDKSGGEMTYTKVKEEVVQRIYIKINIMEEKRDERKESENQSNGNTENKNVTLNDPGAAVVDYGRASQGNMENQQEGRTIGKGQGNQSAGKNEDKNTSR